MIAGTLAGASGQSVDTLLDRVGSHRQRALAAKVHPPVQGCHKQLWTAMHKWHALALQGVQVSNAFHLPKPRIVADAICGAPAQALAAAEEQKLANQKDAADEQLDSASDWEVCQQEV